MRMRFHDPLIVQVVVQLLHLGAKPRLTYANDFSVVRGSVGGVGSEGDVHTVMEAGERGLGIAVGVMHQLVVGHVDDPGVVVDLDAALQFD
jgi:hypothetical protein